MSFDDVAPAVTSISPTDGAYDLPLSTVARVVFSEASDPATATSQNLTIVRDGIGPVSGKLTLDGVTATFVPDSGFAEKSAFTITATTGLTDLAGNPIAASAQSHFRTGSASAPDPPVLDSLRHALCAATISVSGLTEPYFRIAISGGAALATGTADAAGRFSVSVSLSANSQNVLAVVATDTQNRSSSPANVTVAGGVRSVLCVMIDWMSRPLRLEFEGALYHATSRGNERSAIFRDDVDHARFLEFLGWVAQRERLVVHAYCLMGNHYHVLLETPLGNLSRGMQRLNGRYTQYFNTRHRRAGHLFQGRFKSILVEREPHLLELTRYVVLNPVRAGMVQTAGQWPWSNYRATAGRARAPKWLEIDWTLSQFSARRQAAREAYRRFVVEGKGQPSPFRELTGQIYLGGNGFLRLMDARLKGHKIDPEIPTAQRKPWLTDARAIKRAVAREYAVTEADLLRRRGGGGEEGGDLPDA